MYSLINWELKLGMINCWKFGAILCCGVGFHATINSEDSLQKVIGAACAPSQFRINLESTTNWKSLLEWDISVCWKSVVAPSLVTGKAFWQPCANQILPKFTLIILLESDNQLFVLICHQMEGVALHLWVGLSGCIASSLLWFFIVA